MTEIQKQATRRDSAREDRLSPPPLLEMEQDQKHRLVQRGRPSCLPLATVSIPLANAAAGSRCHKCYGPGTPSGRRTVQFRSSNRDTAILPSNGSSPFQIKQEDGTSEKKVPQDIIIIVIISIISVSVDIFIHMYIHTHPQSQRYTHLCRKSSMFSPQSNTHQDTWSIELHNVCLVFRKNIKC